MECYTDDSSCYVFSVSSEDSILCRPYKYQQFYQGAKQFSSPVVSKAILCCSAASRSNEISPNVCCYNHEREEYCSCHKMYPNSGRIIELSDVSVSVPKINQNRVPSVHNENTELISEDADTDDEKEPSDSYHSRRSSKKIYFVKSNSQINRRDAEETQKSCCEPNHKDSQNNRKDININVKVKLQRKKTKRKNGTEKPTSSCVRRENRLQEKEQNRCTCMISKPIIICDKPPVRKKPFLHILEYETPPEKARDQIKLTKKCACKSKRSHSISGEAQMQSFAVPSNSGPNMSSGVKILSNNNTKNGNIESKHKDQSRRRSVIEKIKNSIISSRMDSKKHIFSDRQQSLSKPKVTSDNNESVNAVKSLSRSGSRRMEQSKDKLEGKSVETEKIVRKCRHTFSRMNSYRELSGISTKTKKTPLYNQKATPVYIAVDANKLTKTKKRHNRSKSMHSGHSHQKNQVSNIVSSQKYHKERKFSTNVSEKKASEYSDRLGEDYRETKRGTQSKLDENGNGMKTIFMNRDPVFSSVFIPAQSQKLINYFLYETTLQLSSISMHYDYENGKCNFKSELKCLKYKLEMLKSRVFTISPPQSSHRVSTKLSDHWKKSSDIGKDDRESRELNNRLELYWDYNLSEIFRKYEIYKEQQRMLEKLKLKRYCHEQYKIKKPLATYKNNIIERKNLMVACRKNLFRFNVSITTAIFIIHVMYVIIFVWITFY